MKTKRRGYVVLVVETNTDEDVKRLHELEREFCKVLQTQVRFVQLEDNVQSAEHADMHEQLPALLKAVKKYNKKRKKKSKG